MYCKTEVNRLCRIDLGNEHLDDKLAALGANVERVRGGRGCEGLRGRDWWL
jgi:UDP-N-acetylglucosamine enolpyruvyl transferase